MGTGVSGGIIMQHDFDIAARYLFVLMAIKVLEKDKNHIHDGLFKIKDPYIMIIENAIKKAIAERGRLKRKMYQNKIQVQFLYRQGHFSTYQFITKEKTQEITYMNQVMKQHVEEFLCEILGVANAG